MKTTTCQKIELDEDDIKRIADEMLMVLRCSDYKLVRQELIGQLAEDLANVMVDFIERMEIET